MSIYNELQEIAGDVLSEFKQGQVVLVQLTPGTGPADDPGAATEVSYTLDATAKGVSGKYIRDGFAVAGDIEVISAVRDDVTPNEEDFIEIDGNRYKIVSDMSVPFAGTQVVWKFIVRKGG